MIKTIIIDDEPYCCETLEVMIGKFCPELSVAAVLHSGADALEVFSEYIPQLVFLDIEMPHMTGFEFLEKVQPINFAVIFTTSYDQYAIKAIRMSALDYLLKPIDRNELVQAVAKVAKTLKNPTDLQLEVLLKRINPPRSPLKVIALPTMEGLEMVEIDSIINCTSEGNYTNFFLKDKKKLTASRTLKEVEELLSEYSFIRVHNSFLVNLNEVRRYVKGEGGYLVMSNGISIDVSRTRKELLLQKLRPHRL
ncbi:MAG TPA: LytTR family DNA-binding domain-containing protein [Puia sp.]|jgi:two-component system LytT family response regulator|nr:LytTR family DNA-binding domain-containing protein [Puia sp.]